ncbi:2-dehydropantoate 2-reductase [Sneathiella sp. CAU 1612]|uniref:2-dehydropantoate 2-reductase n=1 Tax=Sneathiella sedimenti TaxID=2816034 RepID=A0ABS3F7V8_9PROT|nr:2-dehydropantoate 2-reductase [Sneathiella sedimenti]MBO0334591.1 2-dehydropantoate 2-reductase [Sneathiella sedimenti]
MARKIGIVGAGAIGGYFAAQLAESGYEVVVLARGKNRDVLSTDGITITSEKGEQTVKFAAVSDSPAELGVCDVVFFVVKGQDTDQAAADMRPMIGPKTEIISLQNGFYGIEHLVATYGAEQVSPGITYIPAVVQAPGRIYRTGQNTRTVFGPYTPRDITLHEELAAALQKAGTDVRAKVEPMREIWAKYVVLAPFHAMCSLTRLPVGGWIIHPEMRDIYFRAMKEVCALGRAKGADVPDSIAEKQVQYSQTVTNPKTRASMFEDLDRGKPLELEPIIGWLCRESEKHGLESPVHDMAYAILRPYRDGRPDI